MQVLKQVNLAPYTTFGIGGPARWFIEASTEEDVLEAVRFAREQNAPLFVLGGGSNLLVSDAGFPGVVLHIALKGIEQQHLGAATGFSVAAGEDWDAFVTVAVCQNCGGIECLAGIPGSVGGTPVQNVGAYGQEVAETIRLVRALDLQATRFVDLSAAECGFAYRRSIFNSSHRDRYIVTSVQYELKNGVDPVVSYADLKRYFQNWKFSPALPEVSSAVREIRRGKGMLIVPGDPDCRSAGSFFKNPVISAEHFEQIVTSSNGANVPHYPVADGQVKVPAAWLLDQAGFHKGYVLGRAGISSKHTLALINRDGASASDIAALRDVIIAMVVEKFAIHLEPEPVWVG
ncbi:UDP-N-acetylmuramate dehydrogenase [Alloacidobacterium sp.]|uniref:UDP-N-acetylmuramate dehydrogenase n=1 Tax=Alloacidobacterium sp. TaxID=2951999 RepID=UPI002D5929B0|nr:UDP-N-acetylmuramate dehydrogenase [Alloacidobacterium sp.]HYK34555.1 UDP-N-acetylmuramate dehydrogenase [Alloacidobacterium sp.]